MYEDALQGEFVLEEAYEGDSSSEEEEDFEADNSFASVEEDDRRHTLKATLDDTDAVTVHGEGVRRRHQLPAPISGDEFSMLGMLRKNVGKASLSFTKVSPAWNSFLVVWFRTSPLYHSPSP